MASTVMAPTAMSRKPAGEGAKSRTAACRRCGAASVRAARDAAGPRERQAEHVAQVVAGIGNEGERVRAQAEEKLGEHERHVEGHADGERAIEAGRRVLVTMVVTVVMTVVVTGMFVRVRHVIARLVSAGMARWAIYHSLPFRDARIDRAMDTVRAATVGDTTAGVCSRTAWRHRDGAAAHCRLAARPGRRCLDESRWIQRRPLRPWWRYRVRATTMAAVTAGGMTAVLLGTLAHDRLVLAVPLVFVVALFAGLARVGVPRA